jgi:epoxyqueuosine reductase
VAPTLEALRRRVLASGFDRAAVAPTRLPQYTEQLTAWIEAGYAGTMEWLTRHREVRLDLTRRFPWACSVLVATRRYGRHAGADGLAPYVATYAQGEDYHEVLLTRLRRAVEEFAREEAAGSDFRHHAYVDTGPALERQLAEAAGLGWRARNGLLLDSRSGSRFFLALLITDLEPAATLSAPEVASCGSCTACQSACPTDAFVAPGVLDARRCISYLTIEHRGSIDEALRPAMGQWLFGCDLCQSCCPFEVHAVADGDRAFDPGAAIRSTSLRELLEMDEERFRERFARTPLWRPRREGLLRNALIVVANGEHRDCVEAARALLDDPSEVLRETASWCLQRLGVASGPVDSDAHRD